ISTRIFLSRIEKSIGQKETSWLELSVTSISPLAEKAVVLPKSRVRAERNPAGPEEPGTCARQVDAGMSSTANRAVNFLPNTPIFMFRRNISLQARMASEIDRSFGDRTPELADLANRCGNSL